jgi:hypothetical protein
MLKMLFGRIVDDEIFAGWERLSNADKRSVVHANQAGLEAQAPEAKRAALPEKPAAWGRFSSADKRTWYLQQEREAVLREKGG